MCVCPEIGEIAQEYGNKLCVVNKFEESNRIVSISNGADYFFFFLGVGGFLFAQFILFIYLFIYHLFLFV